MPSPKTIQIISKFIANVNLCALQIESRINGDVFDRYTRRNAMRMQKKALLGFTERNAFFNYLFLFEHLERQLEAAVGGMV